MARTYKRMSYNDRIRIKQLLDEGSSMSSIADKIGVHRATIYKEIERGGGKKSYNPDTAQLKIYEK